MLQRGRARGGAEGAAKLVKRVRTSHASTGPRPWGRGRVPQSNTDGSITIASTGPRPWGRGRRADFRQYHRRNAASTGPRPWGRGRIETRWRCHPATQASTGPRPGGRGRAIKLIPAASRHLASTGPRPWGRGRPPPGRLPARPVGASTGPRPWGRGRMEATVFPVSAGPASTGPRPWGRGRARNHGRLASQHRRLQRGRARGGAEGRLDCWRRDFDCAASTGPRPWGRGRTGSALSLSALLASFNGAAPVGARKDGRPRYTVNPSCLLQRGRARGGAEGAFLLLLLVQDRNRIIATA